MILKLFRSHKILETPKLSWIFETDQSLPIDYFILKVSTSIWSGSAVIQIINRLCVIVNLVCNLAIWMNRRAVEEDDDLSEVRADAVPPEVRAWLASTFTRQIGSHRKPGETDKPKFRSVAQAIRAGILVERIYRRMSSSSFLQFPAEVARNLKVILFSTQINSYPCWILSHTHTFYVFKYVAINLS